MRVLIDTHVLIWYIEGNPKLSPKAREFIDSTQDQVFLSSASLWEMAIKLNVNKLQLSRSFDELEALLVRMSVRVLPISFADLQEYVKLPLHHRDPFDRMIIAQAIAHSYPLISADHAFSAYPIQQLWD